MQPREKGMRLKGKVAIITGAGRGLGRAISMTMSREGARVITLLAVFLASSDSDHLTGYIGTLTDYERLGWRS